MGPPLPAGVQAIFFDAVGTLIHPHPRAPAVYAGVGRRHGSQLDEATIATRFRTAFQREEEIDRPAGWRTSEQREVARWRSIVGEVLHDANDTEDCFVELFHHFSRPSSWRIDPDAEQVLPALAQRGFVLGVASNFDHRLRQVLADFPKFTCLTHMIISAELGWRKPALEFYTGLCAQTGLDPSRILVVGDDRINDYEGARSAGMHAILVDPENRFPQTNRIERLAELLSC
jgi:putative hydrolase of the HAD superfamily